ncbi:uncharacterized protein JCM10292_002114 [Rhodotorula paludigena]|uniref:uncharacterized protein n=1 Tax=Rhodotorula paludigena TaxID=86838 RepID=UPI00317B01A5
MEFANGFEEDDSTFLAPVQPLASSLAPSPSLHRPAPPARHPHKQRADTLDLTEESPEPEPRSAGRVLGGDDAKRALASWFDNGATTTQRGAHGGFAAYAGRAGASVAHKQGNSHAWAGVNGSSTRPPASTAGGFLPSHGAAQGGFAGFASPAPQTPRAAMPQAASASSSHHHTSMHSHHPHASTSRSPTHALGRIPVISSASNARMPSAYLSSPHAPTAAQSRQPFPPPPAVSSPDKGKARDNVVDLTADDAASDEDDVVIDESPVCIGQITTYGLVVNRATEILLPPPPPTTYSDGTPLPAAQIESLAAEYELAKLAFRRPLPVHIYRDQPVLHQGQWREALRMFTPERKEMFGFIDYKMADVLGPLLGEGWHGTGITKGGNGKLFCEAAVERQEVPNPFSLRLVLLLFARPFDVPAIASTLERLQPPVYLQHPLEYKPAKHGGARYANPHNPAPGVADAERRRLQLVSGMYGQSGLEASRQVKAVDVQKEQVAAVMENIKSGADIEEVTPPPIVATTLYPHQKQALSFLLDREKIVEIPPRDEKGKPTMVSLWERISDTYGRPRGWRSVVTDLEIEGERPPPQARGAILADDMGLGKTIVIISLVCSTLQDAQEWACGTPDKDKLDPRFDDTVKAADAEKRMQQQGRTVDVGQFKSQLWGIAVNPDADSSTASTSKASNKKKQAKQRREKKREDAIQSRFDKLECRSRATLIVCPLSTVQNWESQFEEHTARVEVDDACADDKTITVEADSKVGKKLKREMRVADSDDEDANSIDNASSSSSAGDVKPKLKGKGKGKARDPALKIYVYHGAQRCCDVRKLADHDVVITTFSTLGTEFSKQQRAEEEREDEEERAAIRQAEADDGIVEVFGFGPNGEILESKPGAKAKQDAAAGDKAKPKRKRKRVEGNGVSPLQAIQWFRVVLDEAHIIKEHKTIQARAACDLSTSRRVALSGTPLQNSLNDIFSLVRFLRLEPFTDRHVWNQYIGVLAQKGDELGVERLKAMMRYITLRRTKDTKDAEGKPILSLPPIDNQLVHLHFTEAEHAFYSSHHQRYKHDFKVLQETDSVMKNFCSILQELLKLRQICVHPALLQDSEDRAAGGEDGGSDLIATIAKHGISKPRAVQLLALMRDAGGGDCAECGYAMPSFSRPNVEEIGGDGCEDVKPGRKPAKKARKVTKTQTAATSTANSEEDGDGAQPDVPCVVTRCQHVYCIACFRSHVCTAWPDAKSDDKATCSVCQAEIQPALDAVELDSREYQKALERALDEGPKGKKTKRKSTRLFEHSTKTRALLVDLIPFSQVNPHSENFSFNYTPAPGTTIGFQPVQGEIVKSVVFSQWTTLLDRLGDALSDQKIKFDRLDGGMNRDQRSNAMAAFKSDPACEVLLVSLRAGGVGLNLTAGRRVYLMEPFWNPAVENQAVDRIYRLGQTKPVQTVRFVMKDTIETNMLKIQQRKMELASMSIGRTLSKLELQKQRREELELLFS